MNETEYLSALLFKYSFWFLMQVATNALIFTVTKPYGVLCDIL